RHLETGGEMVLRRVLLLGDLLQRQQVLLGCRTENDVARHGDESFLGKTGRFATPRSAVSTAMPSAASAEDRANAGKSVVSRGGIRKKAGGRRVGGKSCRARPADAAGFTGSPSRGVVDA